MLIYKMRKERFYKSNMTYNLDRSKMWERMERVLEHIANHLGHKSAVSTDRYSYLSEEATLETGASTKRLYG